jgi:hypothetical protein
MQKRVKTMMMMMMMIGGWTIMIVKVIMKVHVTSHLITKRYYDEPEYNPRAEAEYKKFSGEGGSWWE